MHDTQTIQLALTAVAAVALALQTIFMIVLAVIAIRAVKTVRAELDEYRSSAMPIIEKTRDLLEKIAPKIEDTVKDVSEISKSLRTQTADIQTAANELIERTRRQASRVDNMLTAVFDCLERAGTAMSEAVAKPLRQLSGLIASVKAAVETLRDSEGVRSGAQRPAPPPYPDVEHFSGPRTTGPTTPFRP